ncbi:thiamine-phosphate kinase [candidate division WOR-1 bacterium RIFOXYA12_FULL_52_29]|uniref:Thiamine-monophosphate kinase n=1 Tax=candidate division WOR-1 bacterium RIFOXYC12_FULL_54_18 TaxID=1802584 RepID=A0A1F4T7L9_UNCSA|nr:MAG: thiamine-phosphate kinase [candidate division WOR-1 bacterium RIFOXYA2_FULL_51_19]OGC18374.1 MAG: thiamine-phosphate kinase [candidate division WOR-1 bacterium RIFOXYA12_FULL_52_29]OGC27229.1 MAG: thiamine-phosphate kinase [candidate division WOR-1 bacterium RIFOXYB2_FULL_45_9]OGC28791.1 MAG: thiamine-phosphate kinase [candidate division WOR-1 bacterium RIFOXYC12_FULL_54_18]OGC30755.1 MAG: thiamine-phosphate kinase [candidate division WOR-1 bacterium RIFOXYB12_FULL_52_16]
MKLVRLGEFGLIDHLTKHLSKGKAIVGVGDDAAVVRLTTNNKQLTTKLLLITTDALVQDVHFTVKNTSFADLGYKALAANVSDIAAMGGTPTAAVITLALPPRLAVNKLDDLYRGLNRLAKKLKIDIVGGDTVASPKAIMISITLLGEVSPKNLILRSTAKIGDLICVTGAFGLPAARKFSASVLPPIRLKEAAALTGRKLASAMIDSSDGLVRSIVELTKASGVGARLWEERVPIAPGATIAQALYGGEEYELIFTVPKARIKSLKKLKFGISVVGEIADRGAGVKLVDRRGKIMESQSKGFEHFK